MLDGLDEIPWDRLTDFWGTAEHIPGEIRALTAPDSTTRRRAISNLAEGLCNDSAVSEATIVAVPFFIELVGDDRIGDRHDILGLLGNIARCLSTQEGWLRENNPAEFRQPGTGIEDELRLERDARDAVGEGFEQYLRLLREPDSEIQTTAMYPLVVFRERWPEVAEALWSLVDNDPDPDVRANALLGLSVVLPTDSAELARFEQCLNDEERLVRFAAALAIAHLAKQSTPAPVIAILCDTITDFEIASFGEALWETNPAWALGRTGPTLIRQATGLLFDKLAATVQVADNPLDRAAITAATQATRLLGTILGLHFDTGRIWPSSAPTLNRDRREVLATILRMDRLWEAARSPVRVLGQYGLPETREELGRLLTTPERAPDEAS